MDPSKAVLCVSNGGTTRVIGCTPGGLSTGRVACGVGLRRMGPARTPHDNSTPARTTGTLMNGCIPVGLITSMYCGSTYTTNSLLTTTRATAVGRCSTFVVRPLAMAANRARGFASTAMNNDAVSIGNTFACIS